MFLPAKGSTIRLRFVDARAWMGAEAGSLCVCFPFPLFPEGLMLSITSRSLSEDDVSSVSSSLDDLMPVGPVATAVDELADV